MNNSKLTAARAVFPLFALGLIVPACFGGPESDEDEYLGADSDENVAETADALTTVTTSRGTLSNSSCNTASTVSLSLGSNVTADKLAPWKTLAAGGTFSLGSGANGVQIRYWIDNDNTTSQTDAAAGSAASGTWSWTRSNLTCAPHTFTVCAIPYVNGNACGDLSAPTTAGYRVCRQVSFRGCSNAVGVIPDFNTSCPAGTDTLTRHMDDQDDTWFSDNNNDRGGWLGATGSSNNTDLSFCRVDGTTFKPLTSCSSDTSRDYAVLKLGTVCPNGSVEFSKFINNENDRNANSHGDSSGDHYPSEYTENTKLYFCFFGSASSQSATMGKFPSQGIPYGVFGRSTLVNAGAASTAGWFRSDDEDDGSNSYSAPTSILSRAAQIISSDSQNTTFNTAKVNTASSQGTGVGCNVCGDGTCQSPENGSSCPSDCAYCGDEICNNGETRSSCASDCGYCGDGYCDSDESSTTCPEDCGSSGCCTQAQAEAAKSNSLVQPCPCVIE
ncbi:MAG TPA: hypothetical protein PK156_15445 [Polyangium sp.]|nr:hypothetical protein [Polyangium sp.]